MIKKLSVISLLACSAVAFDALADQTIEGSITLSSKSDGTAPLYDCSAPTLPFFFPGGVDANAAIGNIPAGEPIVSVKYQSCDFTTGQPYQCTFTCETITGAACIGVDCANGENMSPGELLLKENNTRIRLTNTAVAPEQGSERVYGESWNVEANDSLNGGDSYMAFQVKSVVADNPFSDGTAKAYDCDDLAVTKYDISNVPSVGFVPRGEVFYNPVPVVAGCEFTDGKFKCFHTCQENTQLKHTSTSVLTLGRADNSTGTVKGVAIGYDTTGGASPVAGTVSLGHDSLKRQMKFLADAVNATDAVNLRSLKFAELETMLAQVEQLNATLDTVEGNIDAFEQSITEVTPLEQNGNNQRLDLYNINYLTVSELPSQGNKIATGVVFRFSSKDGMPLDGLAVKDEQGNVYGLSGKKIELEFAAIEAPFSVKLSRAVGREIKVQWWYLY